MNIAHPKLTILHNMPSSGNSPIIGLAWHNSSMRQESIMLASQKQDGGLRLWSIPKRPSADGRSTPRTIRNLVRHGDHGGGPRWFGWSKSGRIVEYCNGQVYIWDVRTTNVTFVTIQLDQLRGIANHGPMAILFTLTPNMKINKYSINPLEGPKILGTKTCQAHELVGAPPPDPYANDPRRAEARTGRMADNLQLRDLQDSRYSNSSPAQREAESQRDQNGKTMPQALMHYTEANITNAGSPSVVSNGSRGGASTYISSTVSSHYTSRGPPPKSHEYKAAHTTPQPQEDEVVKDLFPYIRASLAEVQFVPPQYDRSTTAQDLPKIILKVIFGWESDIRSLLREEFDHQPLGSPTTEILLQWFSAGSRSKSSMFSRVKAMTGTSADVTEALFQSLIEAGDIHTAVSVLLTVAEFEAAIDTYVSCRMMMEAVLLACAIFPQDWKRQVELVRRWGEIAVTQRQHELSMRCFSVTTLDLASQWPSSSMSGVGSSLVNKSLRLKVVTNFGNGSGANTGTSGNNSGFHGDETVTATPIGLGVTPIVETALSPVGGRGFFGRSGRSVDRTFDAVMSPAEHHAMPAYYTNRGKSRSRDPSESGRSSSSRRNRGQSQEGRMANLSLTNGKGRERDGYSGSVATTLSSATLRSQSTVAAVRPAQVDPYRVKTVQDYIGHLDEANSSTRPRRSSRHRQTSEVRTGSRNGGYVPPAKHSPSSPISMPISMPATGTLASEEEADRPRGRSIAKEGSGSAARSISRPHRAESERRGREPGVQSPASPLSAPPARSSDDQRSQSRQGRSRNSRSRDPPPVRSPSEAVSRRHELTLSRVSERSEQSTERIRDENIVYTSSSAMDSNVPELPRANSTPISGRNVGLPSNPGALKFTASGPNTRGNTPLAGLDGKTLPATTFGATATQTTTLHRKSFSHSRNKSASGPGSNVGPPSQTAPLYGAFPRDVDPPVLPELQHLNGPTRPPNGAHSSSLSLGVIRIGMEDMRGDEPDRARSSMDSRAEVNQTPALTDISISSAPPAGSSPTASQNSLSVSKSGRGRVSISETVSQKLSSVRERMRSSSRSRRSHALGGVQSNTMPSPYDQTAVMINNLNNQLAEEKAKGRSSMDGLSATDVSTGHATSSRTSTPATTATNQPQMSSILKPTYIGYPRPQDLLANLNATNNPDGASTISLPVLAPATYSATKS